MPKVLVIRGFKFFFYSNEGDPLERMHIHVRKNQYVAKFWLGPTVQLASSWGFTPKELNWLEKTVLEHQEVLAEAWNEYFG
jgi:hypothetical protein